ncbi:NAD(P)-dependent oxidoreductase [Arthrobacter wenxiniae]|nr:NAD(P)H-binding protein [Arthrobacter wenxiniae]
MAVFRATGKTGRLPVAQALQAGETVRVLARNPAKLGMTDERLAVVTGELSDVDAIEKVVAGADGVVSLPGQGLPVKGRPIAHGTQNILAAMRKFGVGRIVAIATACRRGPKGRADPAVQAGHCLCPGVPARSL